MSEFIVGDVVQLNSGGPFMTVVYVGFEKGLDEFQWCVCQYFHPQTGLLVDDENLLFEAPTLRRVSMVIYTPQAQPQS